MNVNNVVLLSHFVLSRTKFDHENQRFSISLLLSVALASCLEVCKSLHEVII